MTPTSRSSGPLDLLVAFVSGLAAAYATSRPNLVAALPGVAIAASLVPPLATSGLFCSLGEFGHAAGAGLLFLANMIAIVLASAIRARLVAAFPRVDIEWVEDAGGPALLVRIAGPAAPAPGLAAELGGLAAEKLGRPVRLRVQVVWEAEHAPPAGR